MAEAMYFYRLWRPLRDDFKRYGAKVDALLNQLRIEAKEKAAQLSPATKAFVQKALHEEVLGKVVRIVDFGAFVEIFPGTDGLRHISEISESRIKQVRDELNDGDGDPQRAARKAERNISQGKVRSQ